MLTNKGIPPTWGILTCRGYPNEHSFAKRPAPLEAVFTGSSPNIFHEVAGQ